MCSSDLFMNDPDRFDVFDALLRDFVREFVLADDEAEEVTKARKAYERLMEQARLLRFELVRIEDEQDEATARIEGGSDAFPQLFRRKGTGSAETRGEIEKLRIRSAPLEKRLAELAVQIESAKQRMEFLDSEYQSRLGDYLNQPANARRLFDVSAPVGEGEATSETRAHLLQEWVHKLEERDLLFHVLASYELRKIYYD